MKNKRFGKGSFLKVAIAVFVFWLLDWVLHFTGVGETNFYYLSKLGNAILFSVIWFFVFAYKEQWKKITYSFLFGTYISFYYLIASYSGLVQFFFGVYARYSAPPFVIFGVFLPPFFWWVYHALAFYLGVIVAEKLVGEKV